MENRSRLNVPTKVTLVLSGCCHYKNNFMSEHIWEVRVDVWDDNSAPQMLDIQSVEPPQICEIKETLSR